MITRLLDPREVKRAADFVAIVSRYTKLRRAGQQFVALCPFHSERTPSFWIDPRRKVFKCFGRCDAGGDIFEFVMRAEGCGFPEAVRIVAGVSRGQRAEGARSGLGVRGAGFAPLVACEARALASPPSEHDVAVARLDATEARLRAIRAANEIPLSCAADRAACKPRKGEGALLLVNERVTGHE